MTRGADADPGGLYPGQHLSAAASYANELAASVRADNYGLILLVFPVIGLVIGLAGGGTGSPRTAGRPAWRRPTARRRPAGPAGTGSARRPPTGRRRYGRAAAGWGWFVMGELTGVLAGMLRYAARMLPPGRREWAEAVQAEAGQVPPGWPRLRWLAGGLWLVAREATMMRKAGYWLGAGAVAAGAAWVVWLSWQTSPAADPQAVTDRVRVLGG
jgi:hypothetical protein